MIPMSRWMLGLLRAWWVDPLIATVAFGAAINIYWREERKQGLSCYNQWNTKVSLDPEKAPVFVSLVCYWAGILVWKLFVSAPGELPDGIPVIWEPMTSLYLIAEVVSGILLYDALFFFVHLAMHECVAIRNLHARHHSRPEGTLEARDVLRHSFADGSLQVILNIVAQRRTPWGSVKSRLARALHNVIVTWMLTESHTASPTPNVFRRWFVGVREHRMHHLGVSDVREYGRYHRHQQFFGYLDDFRSWCLYVGLHGHTPVKNKWCCTLVIAGFLTSVQTHMQSSTRP
mmetsp:Transcript_30273/g.90165  ORF Transcript_30273/g.90165 Transcript_30273/m.90165 type:complete len:288 (-) Transcript_30273:995-1858(-)